VKLVPGSGSRRPFVLLAPHRVDATFFTNATSDPSRHLQLLAEAQKLRGKTYLEDGAIESWQLSSDGRHVQTADYASWHLLTLDEEGHVAACARYLPHSSSISFSDLGVAHSALAQCPTWGPALREAIEGELASARRRKCSYSELGGWAITEKLRCTTEAIRMALTAYSLSRACGGALGISTVTLRHCSASILRRIGGTPLTAHGVALPSYYDPQYKCDMEILRFESSFLNPRYEMWVDECESHLRNTTVIEPVQVETEFNTSLRRLQLAVPTSGQHDNSKELLSTQTGGSGTAARVMCGASPNARARDAGLADTTAPRS
jgi:hypothetical protein